MSYAEAYRLTLVLAADPSSQIGATLAGWDHPTSREALILMDAYDLSARVAAGGRRKTKPYPRPWPDKSKRTFGAGRGMPIEQMRALLDAQRDPETPTPRKRDSRGRFVAA